MRTRWIHRAKKIAILVITCVILLPCSTALADQANPDSTPTVEMDFYQNLLETGDVLLIIYAVIPYAATPDDSVGEAFIWRLIDTDNVSELGSDTGYVWVDNGYGYNVFSMYFNAADNLTWNSDYILRLSGNPAVFITPPEYNYPVSTSDYSDAIAATVKTELATRILTISTDLDIQWGLGAAYSLLLEEEAGTVLSIYGEAFYRNAIYGIQALCPQLFRFAIGDIEVTDREWDTEYTDNLSNQYTGTWIETAQSGGAGFAGTTYDWLTILLVMGMAVAAIFAGISLSGGDAWAGMIDGGIVLLGGARLAFFDPTFAGLVVAICWLYVSAKVWSVLR